MAVLPILQLGHPTLRMRAREVWQEELASSSVQTFIDDLVETMRAANGAGLAATQVDQPLRICAIEVGENPRYPYKPKIPLTVLINPVIELLGEERFANFEGCLSVPNLRGRVERAAHIRVRGWTRNGESFDREYKGITAGTFQHEVDHLDGGVFLDRVTDPSSLCTWENFERYEREKFVAYVGEVVARYGQ